MTTLTFPRYSFVQNSGYSTGDCYHDPSFCLPLSTNSNLQFTCQISGADILWLLDHYVSGTDSLVLYAAVVPPDYNCNPGRLDYTSSPGLHPLFHPHAYFIVGQYAITDLVTGVISAFFNTGASIDDFAALTVGNNGYAPAVGDCFKLSLFYEILRSGDGGLFVPYRIEAGCTNCFKRTNAVDCYTSLLTYSNPTDTFDFIYSIIISGSPKPTQNKVELPMYLRDPIMNDDTKVYTRSDGSIVKLYERKEEQYMLETDLMPYTWLKALDIALSHDYVSIQNVNAASYDSINTAQTFQKKDNLDIEYQKGPLTALGKGSCKLLNSDPVHLYNNNCA